jgi:formylglycine-generating enzyme required for sulfatase activity
MVNGFSRIVLLMLLGVVVSCGCQSEGGVGNRKGDGRGPGGRGRAGQNKQYLWGPPINAANGICAKGAPPDPDFTCDWVTLEGGRYIMGTDPYPATDRESPRHPVTIKTFDMWRTENTVAQYRRCVEEGFCLEAMDLTSRFCNYAYPDRDDYPVNCIDWLEARNFCRWLGGRLPSESEWEYAARSGGKEITYPWGNEPATCERAVIDNPAITVSLGCYLFSTWPVCSRPLGNSAQGLCDLSGNVYEWIEDWVHYSYNLKFKGKIYPAPDDGSPWLVPLTRPYRVLRGGGVGSEPKYRVYNRVWHAEVFQYGGLGVRCARDH